MNTCVNIKIPSTKSLKRRSLNERPLAFIPDTGAKGDLFGSTKEIIIGGKKEQGHGQLETIRLTILLYITIWQHLVYFLTMLSSQRYSIYHHDLV